MSRELLQQALDAILAARDSELLHPKPFKNRYLDIIGKLEAELAKPEPTPRQLQRLRQEAWKNIKQEEYKFDHEVCFAMGFDAGYGAVARKVEPSQDECGGFDSRPAPLKEKNGGT